jgi:streptogramin lyase
MIKLILIFLLANLALSSEEFRLYNWKSYSSQVSIRDVASDKDGNLWCATSGGVVKYNFDKENFDYFDNINGLSSVNYSAIEYIPDFDLIVAGNLHGNLDLIFADGRVLNIYDIYNSNLINKRINDLKFINGILYVGGGFGLAEFIPNPEGNSFEQTFADSYRLVSVNKIHNIDNRIYITTEKNGIQWLEIGNIMSNPRNWTNIDLISETQFGSIVDMKFFNDKLYFCNNRNVFKIESDTVSHIFESNYDLNMFFIHNDKLYLDNLFGYRDIDQIDRFDYFGNDTISSSTHNGVFVYENELILFGEREGLLFVDMFKNIVKKTPLTSFSNSIFDMEVDSKGNLWISTATTGFMKFDGQNWSYFNSFIKDIEGNDIPANSYRKLSINSNDDVFIGHRGTGTGLLVVDTKDENYKFRTYSQRNSAFQGIDIDDDNSFFEAAGTAFDRNNISWTINWADFYPGHFLVAIDGDKHYGFNNCIGLNRRGFYHIAIDNNGTKWIGADYGRDQDGIILFNENGTLEDTSDDICVQLRTNNVPELANNVIRSLAVDKNGWVWAGTNTGITYFLNPIGILYDSNPRSLVAVSPTYFVEFDVADIFVDEINYKWIATSSGVYVYNGDGTKEIARINTENSPLPTNDIRSITINPKTGEVFFGTGLGLFSANSVSVRPSKEYDIICYPQPFSPQIDMNLTIEGLAGQSDIRIITPNGQLVRQIDALGDKIFWDGKDKNGNFVNSGVYLILASSGTSNIQSVQKVAVINK